jgi:hypothetical protein
MELLIKFPSRSRPRKLLACIQNIIDHAVTDQYHILLTLDKNDYLTNTLEMREKLAAFGPLVSVDWGHSFNKIDAVNRGVPESGWRIIMLTSDDMQIDYTGFDKLIIDDFNREFPDGDGVLQYPDGFTTGILTLPIMDKIYYDRTHYIYHHAYKSLFCDEEAIIVAKQLGRLWQAPTSFYRHMHPANVAGLEVDAQLAYTQSLWAIDKKTFEARKRFNFYLPK